jgi:transcriptional regulator with GAF, ATPase, and Fis domain
MPLTRAAILAAVAAANGNQAEAARALTTAGYKVSRQRISVVMAEERSKLLAHQPRPGRPSKLSQAEREERDRQRAATRAERAEQDEQLVAALVQCKGNAAAAAELLELKPNTVQRRIARSTELQELVRSLGREPGLKGRPAQRPR